MVVLSELNLFKDIIPGYKIRELTEEEKKITVRVSLNAREVFYF